MGAAQKSEVIDRFGPGKFIHRQIVIDESVNRVASAVSDFGEFRHAGLKRGLVGGDSEGESGLPLHAFVDPLLEDCELLPGDPLVFDGRHLIVGVRIENQFDKVGFLRIARFRRIIVEEELSRIDRKPAFGFLSTVTFSAVLLQYWNHVMYEIDFSPCFKT